MAALLPPEVVTTTLAFPAVPDGVTAVIVVLLTTITLVAGTPPMVTPVAPVKFVPVMVTGVPPAVGPLDGEIPVTVGGRRTFTVLVAVALLTLLSMTVQLMVRGVTFVLVVEKVTLSSATW